MDKTALYKYLDDNQLIFTDVSDKIWDFAETAFEEFQSASLLKKALLDLGFSIEDNIGGIETAFSAAFGSGGPVIGILGEFDALSGLSQKPDVAAEEALTPGGNGHGCGHNLFAGATLGAAAAIASYLAQSGRPGTVKFFGCPGEEGGSGKAFMARAGAFKGLDLALTWHPMSVNAILDMCFLANYQVLYKFHGVAAHASSAPHKGRSALDAVELMNVGVNFLREHVIQEARIHYAITNSGGFSPNVVQASAEALYLMRAPFTPQVEEIYRRINKIALGASLMTETRLEVQFIKACANVIPNKTLSKVLYDNLLEQRLPEYSEPERAFAGEIAATIQDPSFGLERYLQGRPAALKKYEKLLDGKSLCDQVLPFYEDGPDILLAGSSDVGDVSWNVPTAQLVTACYALGTPEHSWQLVAQGRNSVAHKGLMLAAKVMAGAAADLLEQPETIARAKAELDERLGGHTYKCAIPDEVKPRPISKL